MTDLSELLDEVNATAAALHRHGTEYVVTGSFASSVHGEFCATKNIDIVAVLDVPHLVDVSPCVSAFKREAICRAVAMSLPGAGEPLRVASLEDIALCTLCGFRLGGERAERQQRDVRRSIAVNGARLDAAYLEQWATELKVDDLLSVSPG